jgi:peptidoglycan hydrolase-like protein with peptidoglycan-binding domain
MNRSGKNSRWPVSALVTVLLVAVSCLLAVGKSKAAPPHRASKKKAKSASKTKAKPAAHHSASTKKVTHSTRRRTSSVVRKTSSRRRRRLPHSSRGRLALLHLDSGRVEEIQQALIREGVLNGPPSGTWDDATKTAMRRYQSENGFAETGLPEAKSLMKLGLGPHPLPVDVAAAAANSDGQSKIDSLEHPNPNN